MSKCFFFYALSSLRGDKEEHDSCLFMVTWVREGAWLTGKPKGGALSESCSHFFLMNLLVYPIYAAN